MLPALCGSERHWSASSEPPHPGKDTHFFRKVRLVNCWLVHFPQCVFLAADGGGGGSMYCVYCVLEAKQIVLEEQQGQKEQLEN